MRDSDSGFDYQLPEAPPPPESPPPPEKLSLLLDEDQLLPLLDDQPLLEAMPLHVRLDVFISRDDFLYHSWLRTLSFAIGKPSR